MCACTAALVPSIMSFGLNYLYSVVGRWWATLAKRSSGVPVRKLVPLSEVLWEEGICESWMVCPFLGKLLRALGAPGVAVC